MSMMGYICTKCGCDVEEGIFLCSKCSRSRIEELEEQVTIQNELGKKYFKLYHTAREALGEIVDYWKHSADVDWEPSVMLDIATQALEKINEE